MEGPDRDSLGWLGIAGLIITAIASVSLWNTHETSFSGGMAVDRFALYFNLLFCLGGILALLMSMNYLENTDMGLRLSARAQRSRPRCPPALPTRQPAHARSQTVNAVCRSHHSFLTRLRAWRRHPCAAFVQG